MKSMLIAFMLLLATTLISGVIYPLCITAIGQLIWQKKSNGSLVKVGDKVLGSELLAQRFTEAKYFWPRPSASDFNAVPTSASNLGPTSKTLLEAIEKRRLEISGSLDIDAEEDIPMDLLTASGSGLDPHISLASARLQVNRIVTARSFCENSKVQKLIDDQLEKRSLGIFGEPRVNVFLLNLNLDRNCSHE